MLVDEFQDTSRAQWRLVRELMSAWAEGAGTADDIVPPSIFIVGDRKQSIYGFRDAEVAVLEEAARHINALRPDLPARAAITRSHRAVLPLLHFVNDVFDAVDKQPLRADAFRYSDDDRFPLATDAGTARDSVGLVAARTDAEQAEVVAEEIARLLEQQATVRDRMTGARRTIGPGDIAVLFRTREGHRLFEQALAKRRVPFYVYKGLGFFDADEIKDVLALLAFLGDPSSNLRAAALLRSRLVRVSDEGLKQLAPDLAGALDPDGPALPEWLSPEDAARLTEARRSLAAWLPLVDRLPPAELLDRVLAEAAYMRRVGGPGPGAGAREPQEDPQPGPAHPEPRLRDLERLVEHFSQLVSGGDESNAIIDAVDAVNLMTVHAAKGLEFPVVFVVNLGRGSGGGRDPIRVAMGAASGEAQGEPMVAIGEHESEADEDAAAREAEETKRLLYVALTRARDRLYLCATFPEEGKFAPVKGSLGRLLPPSLLVALATATGRDEVPWTGPSASHTIRVVPPAGVEPIVWSGGAVATPRLAHHFAPLSPDGAPRRSTTVEAPIATAAGLTSHANRSSSLLGTLVHRLLAFAQQRNVRDADELARVARQFIEGGHGIEDAGDIVRRAVSLSLGVLSRPELLALPVDAQMVFEVAYSRRLPDGAVERGAIDCLVVTDDTATVLEFKTGAPREEHRDQLAAYVEAIAGHYVGRRVEGRLIYIGSGQPR